MSELILNESIRIGRDAPVFIIAEAGVNHMKIYKPRNVWWTKQPGLVRAVKFQSFLPRAVTVSAPKAAYQYRRPVSGNPV